MKWTDPKAWSTWTVKPPVDPSPKVPLLARALPGL
jgi:hypothetical protein